MAKKERVAVTQLVLMLYETYIKKKNDNENNEAKPYGDEGEGLREQVGQPIFWGGCGQVSVVASYICKKNLHSPYGVTSPDHILYILIYYPFIHIHMLLLFHLHAT